MTYGPPPGSPADQPGGGYGPHPGGQPGGGYGPSQGGEPGAYGPPQGGQPGAYGPPQGGQPGAYGAPQSGYGMPPQYGAQPGVHPGGPQPGGPYGGSPYGAGSGKTAFDPKSVNPLDWAAIGLPILALIFSFTSFYTASVTVSFGGTTQSQSAHESAWHGFFGWFAVLLALVAAALIALELFAPQVKLPVATRLAAVAAFALAVLFMIIALFVTPGTADNVPSGYQVDYGRGYGFWLTLILIVASLVVTFMRFQQTGGSLADFGGLGNRQRVGHGSNSGAAGPQPSPGYGAPTYAGSGQQPGYVSPPPPQGYQPPPPPSAGYPPPPGQYAPTQQHPVSPGYQPQGYQPQPPPGGYQPPAGGYQPQPPPGPAGAQPPTPQSAPPPASSGEPEQPPDRPSQS